MSNFVENNSERIEETNFPVLQGTQGRTIYRC